MDSEQVQPSLKLTNVVDNVPKRITQLEFGILSNQDIANQSVLDVSDRNIYDLTTQGQTRALTQHGPMDRRLGTSQKNVACETCHEPLQTCNGHFGQIRLALPAFHIGYLKNIIDALHNVCKRRSFLRSMRRPALDNLQRTQISRKVSDECRKRKVCIHCNAVNGPIRKVAGHPLKLVHLKYDAFNRSTAKSKVTPESKIEFDASFQTAKEGNIDLEKNLRKAVDDMHPLRVLNIFRRISNSDCELLGLKPGLGRPELFIWQYVPVPPVSIRPSVAQESGNTEDDLTNKLGDIIHMSSLIRAGLEKGQPIQNLMEQWDFLQLQIAMYINSEVPGLQQPGFGKAMRGFCQRLKGKQGRFRQNLSGKRVDFSGRTVIGPDPNLGIDEVAVPMRVATNLTFPEKVSRYNIEKLRACIRRGPHKHPGANFIVKPAENKKISLPVLAKSNAADKLERAAKQLQIGDIVERHLEDGDIVLFNRQPSLHKLSILSHKAKIRPWRTFRLNECVCNPYNADFDGDEMNLHVPQTEEARAEAIELMGVKHNLATPKNGTPIIAAIQDFITAAYLLSSKENFYDRKSFTQICSFMFNADCVVDPDTGEQMPIEIPEPAIFKPQRLWTGKQVFNVLLRPNKKCKVLVNLDAPCKQYKPSTKCPAPDLNEDDAWLVIRNSEVMCGVMDKSTVGDGKKDSVFYVIMRDFGPDHAVQAMNRLSKLSARWLSNQGFSIGINDVTPGAELVQSKQRLVSNAYEKCDKLIADFKNGKLERDAGCTQEQTMENKMGGILSGVRQDAGEICFKELSKWNAPLIMAKCGSKGSNINVSQMVASVGQQMIGGKRVADGFQDRTLPHFPKAARQPASKGFVSNSFYSGLNPTEFIFHAMSGREGLVDTAVKTAETGYMSRRLMKSLEDLSSQYDNTVRNSSAGIVQFQYGDDNLDPVDMEGKAKPVNFERTFSHAITSTWDNSENTLRPDDVKEYSITTLNAERSKYTRMSLDGTKKLDYHDESHHGVDHLESIRDFLDAVQDFIYEKADKLAKAMVYVGISDALSKGENSSGGNSSAFNLVDGMAKISATALSTFIRLCITKYDRSKVQPGHAVGAVGAQSIGEPGTQMTLKTFHFAGVAGMSITQGVPRIKEIINASKAISTPVISCQLSNRVSEDSARMVKSRIEKTYLRDIIVHIEDVYHRQGGYLSVRIDWDTVHKLHLDLTPEAVAKAIIQAKNLKMAKDGSTWNTSPRGNYVRIYPADPAKRAKKGRSTTTKAKTEEDFFIRMQNLKRLMPDVVVKGYPDAQRAIIKKDETPNANGQYELELLVEGYGLRDCMTTPGVEGLSVYSNSVLEVLSVLGIEAARDTIVKEISSVMKGMDIDPRHMQLLADVMTFKGDVLGITRFGLAKMRDSVLQLASFEKTPDHLFEAASKGKVDAIEGVSECIIMGQSVKLGTGAFSVIRKLGLSEDEVGSSAQRRCLFEEGWASAMQGVAAAA
ncbi:DNA-directed RNA polymerase III subunit RPC1 [Mytilinidion resinicola]|uniref:DNA-directed RNA polymerase subunit n=1 Tax=Mytilinidion resinicola TaxID=574789 RepID=A0A6A6Z610_9PEZI|nr:DNA-directed RNA polymerase III subunit RPC1 [Mytilinidion resinicola]KAF2816470.1 DNA-directed RNA polymerase III subunit RPC1 [Mytilinidion resinicola]